MKKQFVFWALGAALVLPLAARAEAPVPVTVDNFVFAESDMYFKKTFEQAGLGTFYHMREFASVEDQAVIRMNRDTLYSTALFDLDAGPVTVTLPDPGQRFMSVQVITEDQYTYTMYAPVRLTFDRKKIGTRYAMVLVRTLANPLDADDMRAAHGLQNAIKAEQRGAGTFEIPNWDPVSQKKVRDALLVLGGTMASSKGTFGWRGEVNPIHHLIGTALGWGGNPEKDAMYLLVVPARNDGSTAYRLTVKDVPVNGFWSVTVYNEQGYLEANALNAYSFNNLTARKSADGAVTIQFGGCERETVNCLPVMKGWNYAVRLYRPRAAILNGTWKFPEAIPMAR